MTISAKIFTALAAASTLGLAAFATAQPAQAHSHHHHHHRNVGVIVAPVAPRLRRGLWLLLEASARLGQLGLACASRTCLRLETTSNDKKTKRPLRLRGPIFRHAARG